MTNKIKQLTIDGEDYAPKCRSAIRYIGGKYYLAPYIIRLCPPHTCYCEPFGSAGHVIFQKPLVKVNVYNDIDNNLTNFFIVLRDNYDELIRRIDLPYSRYIHDRFREEWKQSPPVDNIERASKWFYLNKTSFNGKLLDPFATGPHKRMLSPISPRTGEILYLMKKKTE